MLIAVPAMPLKKSRLSIGSSLSVALANIFARALCGPWFAVQDTGRTR